ncbi:MAG: peptidoglycan DD-metalloendopeptidase family protein [Porphyromonas sp.]|nr:peptidoglycan DD-metalloendopeptidase family protein [Porphyromonas sp.]
MRAFLKLFLALTVVLAPIAGSAQTQRKSATVRRLESLRKKMQDEINALNKELSQASKDTKSSQNRLALLNRQIETRKQMIETLSHEIEEADKNLILLSGQIDTLTTQFAHKQQAYVKSLQAMSRRRGAKDQLLYLLAAEDIKQSFRRLRYLATYANWQKEEAQKLKAIQASVEKKKDDLNIQRTEKALLLTTREQERERLLINQEESRKEVSRLQKKQKDLQADLKKKKKQAQALDRQIQNQIAKEVAAAQEKARKAAETGKRKQQPAKKGTTPRAETPTEERKADVSGGYAMTKEEKLLSNSFVGNKGKLPMPVAGKYKIVGRFGEQNHSELKSIKINSNGIDIESPQGTEVRAVFNGVVSKVFVVDGYNNTIIVRHGNYLTVYSNITNVYVKAGDKVSTRQKLGLIYSDPEIGGACLLHFQLWKERDKQNPLNWLAR